MLALCERGDWSRRRLGVRWGVGSRGGRTAGGVCTMARRGPRGDSAVACAVAASRAHALPACAIPRQVKGTE